MRVVCADPNCDKKFHLSTTDADRYHKSNRASAAPSQFDYYASAFDDFSQSHSTGDIKREIAESLADATGAIDFGDFSRDLLDNYDGNTKTNQSFDCGDFTINIESITKPPEESSRNQEFVMGIDDGESTTYYKAVGRWSRPMLQYKFDHSDIVEVEPDYRNSKEVTVRSEDHQDNIGMFLTDESGNQILFSNAVSSGSSSTYRDQDGNEIHRIGVIESGGYTYHYFQHDNGNQDEPEIFRVEDDGYGFISDQIDYVERQPSWKEIEE